LDSSIPLIAHGMTVLRETPFAIHARQAQAVIALVRKRRIADGSDVDALYCSPYSSP
jgi:predicted dehydrogenase